MARRPIYSEAHDFSLYPQQSRKGRKRRPASVPKVPTPPSGPPPDTRIGFLPRNLSEEQRREIRARQLLAEKDVRHLPLEEIQQGGPIRRDPVPDHDIYDRNDLDVRDPRGPQYNQVDGETVFPEMLGPRQDREFMRTLSEDDVHPGLPTFDPSTVNASKELIAAVSADDRTILAFDNHLTVLHTHIRRARQLAEQMAQSVRQQDDNPAAPDSPTSHAQNVVQMIARIIEPWFLALDDEFSKLLEGTVQGEAVEEGGAGGL
jgi:hypothetical protein